MLGFEGRVAVITGAGGGLGRAHALELARRGAAVVVNDLGVDLSGVGGDLGPADRVVKEIKELGGEAVANTDSIATVEGGQALIDAAVEAFGRVDIVVNNAGILRDKTFHNTTSAELDPVLAVHLVGAFNVTRPAWVRMREQGYGRVIVTSSSAGLWGNFGQSAYGAAKMGLVGLIKVLAQEGRRYNIAANAIAPMARTRMTEGMTGELEELLGPERVAPVVAYLSHESCALSGEILSVAAGRVARVFVGVTAGFYDPDLSAESVGEHLEEMMDTASFELPGSSGDEVTILQRLVFGDAGAPSAS